MLIKKCLIKYKNRVLVFNHEDKNLISLIIDFIVNILKKKLKFFIIRKSKMAMGRKE